MTTRFVADDETLKYIATLEQQVAELEQVISEHGADMWAQGEEYAALSAKCAQAQIKADALEQQNAELFTKLDKMDGRATIAEVQRDELLTVAEKAIGALENASTYMDSGSTDELRTVSAINALLDIIAKVEQP